MLTRHLKISEGIVFEWPWLADGFRKRRKYIPVGSTPASLPATFLKPSANQDPGNIICADIFKCRVKQEVKNRVTVEE
jgi:hypothetical protein